MREAVSLGYLPENGPLYPEMTPLSMLDFFAEARGLTADKKQERIDAVVEICDLSSVLYKPISKLSKGFKQRVGMSQALLHDPDVLILDEPTAGLDPNQIRGVRRTMRRLGETKTILLSTHILQEVEAMASRVVMIYEGRLVYDGDVDTLREIGEGDLDQAFHRADARRGRLRQSIAHALSHLADRFPSGLQRGRKSPIPTC